MIPLTDGWSETYRCGCKSQVLVATKKELRGSCPRHGERRRSTQPPKNSYASRPRKPARKYAVKKPKCEPQEEVITVRMSQATHDMVKALSSVTGDSMNQLCLKSIHNTIKEMTTDEQEAVTKIVDRMRKLREASRGQRDRSDL